MVKAWEPEVISFGLALAPNLLWPRGIIRTRQDEIQAAAANQRDPFRRRFIRMIRDDDGDLFVGLIRAVKHHQELFFGAIVIEF